MSRIVAISIDKVQTFLYHAIHANKQENQTNSGTLRSVVGASGQISDLFYNDIGLKREGGLFNGGEVLLKCSGMCIFVTSLNPGEIQGRLKKLYEKYYIDFAGQIQLKYVSFEAPVNNDCERIAALKKGKLLLQGKACINRIIEENQDLLFNFTKLHKSESKTIEKKYQFAEDINQLRSEDKTEENRFRIAVIKADLDGMGAFFSKIDDYEVYLKVSEILNRQISLDSLDLLVKKKQEKNPDFKLFPLYIAGDDIFFAVPVVDLLSGINLCTELLENINLEIKEASLKTGSPPLSLSIGVEVIFNREPIRYYYERVEAQLQKAKKTLKPNELERVQYTRICINYSVYFKYQNDDISKALKKALNDNKEIQQWSHLMSGIKLLHTLMQEERQEKSTWHHFLYGLLQKLTDSKLKNNEIKRSNSILYHLLPQYMESSNSILRDNEILFIEKLLDKVTVKTEKNAILCFGEVQCGNLEKYVKLLLLFTDVRFNITKRESLNDDVVKKRVRSHVFNRTLRYLYEQSLYELLLNKEEKGSSMATSINSVRCIFVFRRPYSAGNQKNVEVYQRIPISTSVFYRLKQVSDIKSVSEIIAAMDSRTREEYEKSIEDRESEHMSPPPQIFQKKKFVKDANASQVWGNDYIDSLLLLYKFDDALIRYRKLYPTKKISSHQKGKK